MAFLDVPILAQRCRRRGRPPHRVGRARRDGQYDMVFETAELVEPDPFPEGYQ
jgi:hypothetical protein